MPDRYGPPDSGEAKADTKYEPNECYFKRDLIWT